MDRTNWKFSDTNINILTLGIIYDGMAFPIVFKMMNNRGNSNTQERIELVDRFIRLAGENSINHLMADREFVGSEWPGYLNARGIHYHIRIRENFHVIRHGQESRAYWLFNDLRVGESKHLDGIYYVNGQACYLSSALSITPTATESMSSNFCHILRMKTMTVAIDKYLLYLEAKTIHDDVI